MKIAFYVEDGLEQIILTPESKVEGDMLGKLHDGTRELSVLKGSFYDCRGGWKRYTPYEPSPYSYGTDRGDESTMIVLRAASCDTHPKDGDVEQAQSAGWRPGGEAMRPQPPAITLQRHQ